MACDVSNSTSAYIPWTAQRIANRFPGWSRARGRADSAARAIIQPFAEEMDGIYTSLFMIRDNYFVPSVSLNEQSFAYVLRLPMEFEFSLSEEQNSAFYFPTVTGAIGSSTIQVEPVDEWIESHPRFALPARLTSSVVASGISNTLLSNRALSTLGDSLLDNVQLMRMPGKLYITINGATAFGGETSDGDILDPKVVINGQPIQYDYLDEIYEHLNFPVNGQRASSEIYDSVWSLETRGINNPENTTIEIKRGFNKTSIPAPYSLWVDTSSERTFSHALGNIEVGDDTYNTLQFVLPEYPIAFQQQGFSDEEIVIENVIVGENGAVSDIVDIDRIPFSHYMVAISQNKLSFLSSLPAWAFGNVAEDQKLSVLDTLYKSRTPGAELTLEVDRPWMNLSQDATNGIEVSTHRRGQSSIIRTRLSRWVLQSDSTWSKDYIDWDGNVINAITDPNQGFLLNLHLTGTVSGWTEKALFVNPLDEWSSAQPVIVLQLETEIAGGTIHKDSVLLYLPRTAIINSVDLPDSVATKVAGINYEDGRLLVLTTEGAVVQLDFHYDLALVDYQANTLYMTDSYDSVTVTT